MSQQVEIVPLNTPKKDEPMWHNLTCGRCGWLFSHTDRTVYLCGLCRMDDHNLSYVRKFGRGR